MSVTDTVSDAQGLEGTFGKAGVQSGSALKYEGPAKAKKGKGKK